MSYLRHHWRLLFLALGLILPAQAQLIGYFPFEGGAQDASGANVAATVVNATYTMQGRVGGAYTFDGRSSYISLDLNINPSVIPQLTMGAWVLAADTNPIRQILSHDDGGYDRSLGIDFRGTSTGWSTFVGSGVLGDAPVTAGEWTFVAVAYDQPAGTAMLYVNGRTFHTTGTALGAGWGSTRIGMNPSFGEYFSGTIDEVFFFRSALSAPQLDQIRTSGVLAVPEPPVGLMMAAGFGVLAVAARRRRAPVSPVSVPAAGGAGTPSSQ